LDQFDLVSIDLVDKRHIESAGGAAARPSSPSGVVLSKYDNCSGCSIFALVDAI
jgi:hypothetical protein